MNHLLTEGPLLNKEGELIECGYAFDLVKEYKRDAIKAPGFRIKEWDYYFLSDGEYGIALTIADNSYMALAGVSVLDFKNNNQWTRNLIRFFTFGSIVLPSSSKTGDIFMKGKDYNLAFYNDNGKRRLVCSMKNIVEGKDFSCDVCLENTSDKSMVIVTPFPGKNKHFYYNQKINNLFCKGEFTFGPIRHIFGKKCYGVLDWGRGVWTYSNTWYWSSLNAEQDGHTIGFNLGYGFGDTSAASENMFFYDDKAFKLNDTIFNIPTKDGKRDYLSQWTVTSKNGDIDLVFNPCIDRYSNTNAIVIQSNQHQIFGYFTGVIKAEGKEYKINNLLGFAERVTNRW